MIQLQKFERDNYDILISWIDSAEMLMQFAGPAFSFPLTHEQLDNSFNDKRRVAFQFIDIATSHFIGYAEVYQNESFASLGRIIIGDIDLRGKGIGKQITKLLLDYVFITLKQHQAELNVFDWNVAAIKCYEKVGFEINPHKKLERKINDETWIAINMTLEKKKWQHKISKSGMV